MGFSRIWHRKYRPVTDTEVSARLDQKRSYAESVRSSGTVFRVTDGYLEVCDGFYREKGWGLLAFSTAGIGSLCLAGMFAWMAINVSPAIQQKGQAGFAHWNFGLLSLGALGILALSVRSLRTDCFNYTAKPIRFNRIDRTIYAFRHNGPGGVLSVPWDSAFLYVERKPKAGITATAPRVVRCLVLDEQGRVSDSFAIGKRVVLVSKEEGELGQQVMSELYADFEYYRRFMEEGPSSVPPVAEYLTNRVTFQNSLKLQFEDSTDLLRSTNPFLWLVGILSVIPTFILALAYHVSQLTCSEPVWPEEIERACSVHPTKADRVGT